MEIDLVLQLMARPDDSWAWLVCFASFILRFLTNGVTYTFGILVIQFEEEFRENKSSIVLIGSIQITFMYFTGMVADVLTSKFGRKIVVIAGSVISASGLLISSFMTNIYVMYFTYGVLTGLGYGLMYMVAVVVVQYYFEKKRSTATGIL